MIYQCYFDENSKTKLFSEEPYVGFGLEPDTNPDLFKNCPELESSFNRLQLTEYASYLWLWRNKVNDPWIGSTSYRQLDKNPYKFRSIEQVDSLIVKNPFIGWGEYTMLNRYGAPISLRRQAEVCHPGLNEYMDELVGGLPEAWSNKSSGIFSNYWIMSNDLFQDFMDYSWPLVCNSLSNITNSNFYKQQIAYGTVSKDKCVGYVMERLFILWYLERDLTFLNPFANFPIFNNTD